MPAVEGGKSAVARVISVSGDSPHKFGACPDVTNATVGRRLHTVQSRFDESAAMKHLDKKLPHRGQTLIEQGMLVAMVAIVAMLTLRTVGNKITSVHDNIQSQLVAQGVADSAPQSAGGSSSSDAGSASGAGGASNGGGASLASDNNQGDGNGRDRGSNRSNNGNHNGQRKR